MRFLTPDWPAPPGVRGLTTLRHAGVSLGPYQGFNLGTHVGDHPEAVRENRRQLVETLGLKAAPAWLDQIHGRAVVEARPGATSTADGSFSAESQVPCVVLTADCLPVLFTTRDGSKVAAAHAGWRGLAEGILDATLNALGTPEVLVWLGPAISASAFEVGAEVLEVFAARLPGAEIAFSKTGEDRYHADLYQLARLTLHRAGVRPELVFGGERCTFHEADDFFSYRRDRTTGRMATLIWRE